MTVMLGKLVAALDEPGVAHDLIAALDVPALSRRVAAAARAADCEPAWIVSTTVREFLDTASDDQWLQLIGIMGRAADPGLAAVRAILDKALPAGEAA